MKRSSPLWKSENRLLCGAVVGLIALTSAVFSQTSTSSGGPKFLKIGEKSGASKPAWRRNECDFISHNLRFCADGTDWVLESDPVHGEQSLYEFSSDRRASLTVVPMKESVSRELDPFEVAELLDRHIFVDGPRGRMKIEAIVDDEKTTSGRLLHRRVFVMDSAGSSHLLQVTVLSLDYGLGFLETTIAVPTAPQMPSITEEDIAFHKNFLNRTRVSISISR